MGFWESFGGFWGFGVKKSWVVGVPLEFRFRSKVNGFGLGAGGAGRGLEFGISKVGSKREFGFLGWAGSGLGWELGWARPAKLSWWKLDVRFSNSLSV